MDVDYIHISLLMQSLIGSITFATVEQNQDIKNAFEV